MLAGLSMVYLPACCKPPAVAEHPQQRLGLRLLVAEGQAEADLAQLRDLGGVGLDVGPGLRGAAVSAGLREQLLVVEEGAA